MQKVYQNFSFNRKQDETIGIRLKRVESWKEVPVTYVDHELELPARFRYKIDLLEPIIPTNF